MDVRRHDVQDPFRPRRRDTSRLRRRSAPRTQGKEGRPCTHLLRQKGHRERLVQQPQLARLALLVVRVAKDAAVEQRPVHVGDHAPDVARRVGRAAGGGGRVLDAVEVGEHGRVEVHRVALVERVDLPARRDADVRVREDEVAERGVERVAVHAAAGREDEVRRGAVPAWARGCQQVRPARALGAREAAHIV